LEIKEVWYGKYGLIDLKSLPEESMKQRFFSGLMEYALKNRQRVIDEEMLDVILPWISRCSLKSGDLSLFVITYLLEEQKGLDYELFCEKTRQYFQPELRSRAMTLADVLTQRGVKQGVQQGVKQGVQQGVKQGVQQGVQQVACKMLKQGYTRDAVADITGFSTNELEELELEEV